MSLPHCVAGIYKITKQIEILQSNVVLRGEGVSRGCWRRGEGGAQVAGCQLTDQTSGPGQACCHCCWSACSCDCVPSAAIIPPPPKLNATQVDKTILYMPNSLSDIYGNKEAWGTVGSFLT